MTEASRDSRAELCLAGLSVVHSWAWLRQLG